MKCRLSSIAWFVLLRLVVLILEDRRGGARVAGEEEQQVVLEVEEGFLGDLARAEFHAAVLVEREGCDAADRGDILVLFADGLAELVDLDVAGLLGEVGGRDMRCLLAVWRTFSSAVVKLPEEPSPVPPGMSAIEVSSSERIGRMPSRA